MEIAGIVALVGVGLTLGVMGGGGSIFSVPILIYLFSLDVVMASTYSLFIVGTTSTVGVLSRPNIHLADIQRASWLGVPSVIAVFVTRTWLLDAIPEVVWPLAGFVLTKRTLILFILVVALVTSSVFMIRPPLSSVKSASPITNRYALIPIGLLIGMLSGMAGVGGGFLVLPALVLIARIPFVQAVGTALIIIAFNSWLGFVGGMLHHTINWSFLLSVTALAVVGIIMGNHLTQQVRVHHLRVIVGWISLGISCMILLREIL